MFKDLINFIRELYGTNEPISLHEPYFDEDEKIAVLNAIESTFVSSVGALVNEFEQKIMAYTGSKYAIATVNGTAALHTSLLLSGVQKNDEVITQALTFIATCNAIHYCNAVPIFLDVDLKTLGLSAESLAAFIDEHCELRDDGCCWNKTTNRIVRACVPMHTFGLSVEIDAIKKICNELNIVLIEDAAESLGTKTHGKYTGTVGDFGILSFNGNKIITTGGGGMIMTDDEEKAILAKHITTTAKLDHKWFFEHDLIAFNYRMPNLNAALGIAQLDKLPQFIRSKRKIALAYQEWGTENDVQFVKELPSTKSNYWLNTIITTNIDQRNLILHETNAASVMTRPVWTPMHKLNFNFEYQRDKLKNTEWLFERIVNLPSGIPKNAQ